MVLDWARPGDGALSLSWGVVRPGPEAIGTQLFHFLGMRVPPFAAKAWIEQRRFGVWGLGSSKVGEKKAWSSSFSLMA